MTPTHRLYARWSLAVLAAVLPIAAIGWYSLHTVANAIRRMVREENQGVAAIAAESLHQHFERSIYMGRLIASFPVFVEAVKRHDETQVRERLKRLIEAAPDVDRAFVLDLKGNLWCDWPLAPESLNQNFAHRDYFKGASAKWEPYISEVFQRQALPRPLVIAVSVPIRDPGGVVVGLLVFQHRLDTITGWLKRIGRSRGAEVVVLDSNGLVAGHSRLSLAATRIDDYGKLPQVQEALRGPGRSVDYVDPLTRREMVAAFQTVPMHDSPPWLIIGQQDREHAMAPVMELRRQIGLAATVVALLAIAAAVGLARISEHNRAMSNKLARQNAQLEEAIAHEREAYEKLKRAQEQLVQSEKLASLGQMVAGIAHEINNPLSFVSNNTAVLQRDLQGIRDLLRLYRQSDEKLQQVLPENAAQIRELAERLDIGYTLTNLDDLLLRSRDGLRRIQQIVKDLRDFARLDESMVAEADLNAGIESTVNIVRGRARKKDVQLELQLSTLPPITCALARINQVIMNLLSNAIDACPTGGHIVVRSWEEAEAVCIAVSDNGPGVPPEIQARIFDPFFTTKPLGEGVGLGLSISYGIVRDHAGSLTVHSPPGAGATFTLRLPKASPLAAR